jgi:hypothetical protein
MRAKEKTKESLDLTIMRACTGSGRRRGGETEAAMGDTKTFLRNEARFLDTKNIHVRI